MNCPLCRESRSCQTVSSTYCLSILNSGPFHDFIKSRPGKYHGTCLLKHFPELLDQLSHREGPEITRFRNILLDTEPRFDRVDLRLSASDSELLSTDSQLREFSLSNSPLGTGILTDSSGKSGNESPRSIISPLARRNSIVTYRTTDVRLINFSVALAYQVLKIVKERDLVETLGREAQLAVSVCDLIGVETGPNLIESRVLRQILSEYVEQDPRAVVGLKTIMDHCTEHPQNLLDANMTNQHTLK